MSCCCGLRLSRGAARRLQRTTPPSRTQRVLRSPHPAPPLPATSPRPGPPEQPRASEPRPSPICLGGDRRAAPRVRGRSDRRCVAAVELASAGVFRREPTTPASRGLRRSPSSPSPAVRAATRTRTSRAVRLAVRSVHRDPRPSIRGVRTGEQRGADHTLTLSTIPLKRSAPATARTTATALSRSRTAECRYAPNSVRRRCAACGSRAPRDQHRPRAGPPRTPSPCGPRADRDARSAAAPAPRRRAPRQVSPARPDLRLCEQESGSPPSVLPSCRCSPHPHRVVVRVYSSRPECIAPSLLRSVRHPRAEKP